MTKLLLATLSCAFLNFFSYSQQNDLDNSKRYIKIVVDSEMTEEQQREINLALNQIPGVETSRMDKSSGVFLGIYIPNDNLQDQTFLNWFTNHGYSVMCYYDAGYTPGGMIELSKNNCR